MHDPVAGVVGDGLVPSRLNACTISETGDHKGRPYAMFDPGGRAAVGSRYAKISPSHMRFRKPSTGCTVTSSTTASRAPM